MIKISYLLSLNSIFPMKSMVTGIISYSLVACLSQGVWAQEVHAYSQQFTLNTLQQFKYFSNMQIPPQPDVHTMANQTITISDIQVNAGGSVVLWAGQNVRILEETSVFEGSYFYAGTFESIPTKHRSIYTMAQSEAQKKNITCEQDSHAKALIVYPNPTSGLFTLQLNEPEQPEVLSQIQIYDFQGRLVLDRQLILFRTTEHDITILPGGIYMARVIQGKKMDCIKIAKE